MENSTNVPAEEKGMKNSTKRVITSVVYMAVLVALVALKWCIPHTKISGRDVFWGSLGFDAVFCAIAVLGCLEFLRSAGNSKGGWAVPVSNSQRAFTVGFCGLIVPLYVIVEIVMPGEGILAGACAFAVYCMFLAGTSVFDHGNSTVKGATTCIFAMVYCGILPCLLSAINHLPVNSMAAMLVLFVCAVLTDSGAYVIGSLLKRFIPAKLAPKLSPNKTVIGAVGGLIGGILGSLLVLLIMWLFGGINGTKHVLAFNDVYLTFTSEIIHPVVGFILIGLVASVFAQMGDLFESAIKRECGVKDMGNLLPGHGGILDRFDSVLICGVVVLFCFGTVVV